MEFNFKMWIKNFWHMHWVVLIGLLFLAVSGFLFFKPAAAITRQTPTATSQPKLDPSIALAGFGILGDSNSDEYQADDSRGGEFRATTLNWMEQLVLKRKLNFGPWDTWGEPRRTGYEYNWGRSGATASSMISSGQHLGLAKQIAQGKVAYVFIWIGLNDFHPANGTYAEIYDGSLSDAELQNKIDKFVADVTLAVDTVLAAGDVKIVLVTLADSGAVPDIMLTYPSPAGRQRVTEAINQVNDGLKTLAQERHIAIADVNKFATSLLGRLDPLGRLSVGNESINLLIKGDEPHHMRLDDLVGHAGTVTSGLVANALFIETFNTEYGLNISPFSDEEILATAGISSQGPSNGWFSYLPFLEFLISP